VATIGGWWWWDEMRGRAEKQEDKSSLWSARNFCCAGATEEGVWDLQARNPGCTVPFIITCRVFHLRLLLVSSYYIWAGIDGHKAVSCSYCGWLGIA
jgi:hypothetical protein